jgi:hypothetical protein
MATSKEISEARKQRVIGRAKTILDELRKTHRADSLGAGEIAAEIRRRTSRKRASAASVANALRGGIFHDGRRVRDAIEHPRRRVWNVPIEAVALNLSEIIEGIETGATIDDMLSQWHVVRIEPMEPAGAIAQECVVLDYRPDEPTDPERRDAADVDAFLAAVGAEIQQLDRLATVRYERRVLRRVARRDQ